MLGRHVSHFEFVFTEFLEARIVPERIEHRIEPEQRRSERGPQPVRRCSGIESSFCKAVMARSGSPTRAATRARISIGMGPSNASFSIGFAAMACSDKAKAAALSPRPILIRVRSAMRPTFSDCFLGKVPVRCAPVANFLGRPPDRRRPLAPSLTKSAARHCKNPTLDQAWQVFPLAEG